VALPVASSVPVPIVVAPSRNVIVPVGMAFGPVTVAVKVNLKDHDALDEWLSSSGYPGLEQIKPIAKYDQATEYSDQTYTYFRIGNDVFIFTVSGTDHRPIPFDGDAVFAHLLESFEI